MEWIAGTVLLIALVLLVSWLGGGKKWAFRSLLTFLLLAFLGACGVAGYFLWAGRVATRQRQRVHECAVAKIATAECVPAESVHEANPFLVHCPAYLLSENPTPEEESTAMEAAEKACWAEAMPSGTSLKQEVTAYRRQHGIKDVTGISKATDDAANKTKACAAKVRKAYPGAYDDLTDETLVKKTLAKYPNYCD